MDIVVCIKQVPGTSKVQVDEKTGVLIRSGIDSKLNPYDLYALETALRLKGQYGTHVHVVSMGPPQAVDIIREAFWMGVDEGTLLTDRKFAGSDCLATAYALSQAIQVIGLPDLVICGKQTTDGDTAQVGPEVAEFLGIPHLANVRKICDIRTNAMIAEVDLPDHVAVVECMFPCLISVEKGIFQPRLPSFRLKMATRDRKVNEISVKDLEDREETHYGLKGSPTQVLRIFPPETQGENQIWRGSSQDLGARLADFLRKRKILGD